jgi:glycerophosphoryl diester phosphodiesterase
MRAVEFDVMALRSGELVLMHDAQLGRTIRAEGSVAECTAVQLATADAGAWFSADYVGEPVPTLADAAAFCLRHGLWMNVEIKPAPGLEADTGARVAQTCAPLPAGSVLLSSFAIEALQAARRARFTARATGRGSADLLARTA